MTELPASKAISTILPSSFGGYGDALDGGERADGGERLLPALLLDLGRDTASSGTTAFMWMSVLICRNLIPPIRT